jgi:quercetin dioxygenase-like cupin family protein
MSLCALCVKANSGKNWSWKSDNAFLKVSAKDSSGAFSLIEDNLTTEFHLPRHLHHVHTETFYVVSGKVEFILDDRTEVLTSGDTLHVPCNVPHEVKCLEQAKMLTFYAPGGLEELFNTYENMTEADFADTEKMKALEAKHDSVQLGPNETN